MKPRALLFGLFLQGLNPAQAATNLLLNPSFEQPVLTAADTCDSGTPWCLKSAANTPSWTSFGNGVSLIHNNYLAGNPAILVTASQGQQYLDMNQTGTGLGGISQLVGVTAGQTYALSLDVSAWATNAIGAQVGYTLYDGVSNVTLGTGSFTANSGGWTTRNLQATATSNSMGVRIEALFSPQAAIGVDNVVLSAVPEPQTYALLLVGLAATTVAARRRRAKLQIDQAASVQGRSA